MKNFTRIDTSDLRLGMRFSAPVFFDDGENMFLAEAQSVKPYHLAAVERWNIKYLLTYGHLLGDGISFRYDEPEHDLEELEELEEVEAV